MFAQTSTAAPVAPTPTASTMASEHVVTSSASASAAPPHEDQIAKIRDAVNEHAADYLDKDVRLDGVYVGPTTRATGGPPSDHPYYQWTVFLVADAAGDREHAIFCEITGDALRSGVALNDRVTVSGKLVSTFFNPGREGAYLSIQSCKMQRRSQ